jgi:hypothetical protein
LYFVRKTQATQGEDNRTTRIGRVAADLVSELNASGVSVYRVADEKEIQLVAALFMAKNEKPRGFYYFTISEEDVSAFQIEIEPETEDAGPLFEYLRKRHHEIKDIPDVGAFAAHMARDDARVVGKKVLMALARGERTAPSVTIAEEWLAAQPWTALKD